MYIFKKEKKEKKGKKKKEVQKAFFVFFPLGGYSTLPTINFALWGRSVAAGAEAFVCVRQAQGSLYRTG